MTVRGSTIVEKLLQNIYINQSFPENVSVVFFVTWEVIDSFHFKSDKNTPEGTQLLRENACMHAHVSAATVEQVVVEKGG